MGCLGRSPEDCIDGCQRILATPYSLQTRCTYEQTAIACGPVTDSCPPDLSFGMFPGGQRFYLTCVPQALPTFEPSEVEQTVQDWPPCALTTPPQRVNCTNLDCAPGNHCCEDGCGRPRCTPTDEPCPTPTACDYDPCEGKACGSACTLCDPAQSECIETSEPKTCDLTGICRSAPAVCP